MQPALAEIRNINAIVILSVVWPFFGQTESKDPRLFFASLCNELQGHHTREEDLLARGWHASGGFPRGEAKPKLADVAEDAREPDAVVSTMTCWLAPLLLCSLAPGF